LVAVTTVLTELGDTRANFSKLGAAASAVSLEAVASWLDQDETDAAAAALKDELYQKALADDKLRLEEKSRNEMEAEKKRREDPCNIWFRKSFPVAALVGDVLNSAYMMPFWIVILILDCVFLLFWDGFWRENGDNRQWDKTVELGHFVVSILFAVDVGLRFVIHGLSSGR
jgi:hypothetical protein